MPSSAPADSPDGQCPPRWLRLLLWLLLAFNIALTCLLLQRFQGLTDSSGHPLGGDFIAYWSAASLALQGQAASAYDPAALAAAENLAVPGSLRHPGWFYPPAFMLLLAPLALLSYAQAYAGFVIITLTGYWLTMRRLLRPGRLAVAALALPAVPLNIVVGQNGLLTSTLMALGLMQLPRHPVRAGLCFGLLAIKPHLFWLLPLLLLRRRAWPALGATLACLLVLVLLCTAAFGTDIWPAFLQGASHARQHLETDIPLQRMPTVFAQIRLAGGDLTLAYSLQALIALIALTTLWKIWQASDNLRLQASALVLATLLTSPYLFDYDLAWLLLPVALLALEAGHSGWLPGERLLLGLLWAGSFYPQLLALALSGPALQPTPVLCLLGLLLILRRSRQTATITQGSRCPTP